MEDEADRRLAAARVVVVTQCGERFAYYTLSGTFILFCTKTLGVAPATADAAFSAWTALSFAAPLVGGAVADAWLGPYTACQWSYGVYVLGAAGLATAAAYPSTLGFGAAAVVAAAGCGFAKPAASTPAARISPR